ncbi:hypothetical protein RHMOL_Rhmol06G0278800 [Rhododendron molle]|uniref:Uncharacterized protein n=1 Tax=Rhododendron molle TaxID=49168 RepID=A0ACC0NJD5_RHOML|nr:hypothetical protein RHMOL_Rhmol06G0278800 [Rhododendron molle]
MAVLALDRREGGIENVDMRANGTDDVFVVVARRESYNDLATILFEILLQPLVELTVDKSAYVEAGVDCSWDDLEEKIEDILDGDEEERLISFLTNPPLTIDGTPQYSRHRLLENLCMRDAVKCATALLEGKLGGLGLDLDGDHLLHRAARFCSLDMVQLFLLHKARSDTRYSDYRYDRGEDLRNGLLPLDLAFNFARSQYPSLESYPFGGQSTFEMILYLCQLGAGHVGDTIKLLACSSEDVAKEA